MNYRRIIGPLCLAVLTVGCACAIILYFDRIGRDAMYVQVENVLTDNLAIVKGVDGTPTVCPFLAVFKSSESYSGKSLRDYEGENITIEYRWKDNHAVVEGWDCGRWYWRVVGMRYEAPKEVR
jgi:hypothetical protein